MKIWRYDHGEAAIAFDIGRLTVFFSYQDPIAYKVRQKSGGVERVSVEKKGLSWTTVRHIDAAVSPEPERRLDRQVFNRTVMNEIARHSAEEDRSMPQIVRCPHDKEVGECNDCDIASDLAFDTARERAFR